MTAQGAAGRERRVGLVLVLVSAAAFGSLAVLGKQAYAGGLGVAELLALRFALAAPLLWLLAAATRRRLALPPAAAARLLGMGAVGYALQAILFFSALTRISAGLTGLLLYLYPALVTAGAALLGRNRLDRATLLGLGLALAGTLLVLGVPGERLDPLGVALGLAAACWYSGYILVGEQLLHGVDPLVAAAYVVSGAALSFAVGGAAFGRLGFHHARPAGLAAAGGVAVLGTALAIAAFLAGLARIGSTWAAIGSSLEPVVTVALGVGFLGEPLGPRKVAGGAAVVAGAVLLPLLGGGGAVPSRRSPPATADDVDDAGTPVVSSQGKRAPIRGSTHR